MKAIILAAGKGSRLGAFTESRPKCMLRFGGRPLVHHQLDALKGAGISDVSIVAGYHADLIDAPGTKVYLNRDYEHTNMVVSLMAAAAELQGDVIVVYGDIIFDANLLATVLAASACDIGVTVDRDWQEYYAARFDDPASDAESLSLSETGTIRDIGRANPDAKDVHGRYVGVLRFTNRGCEIVTSVYAELQRRADAAWRFRSRSMPGLFMTDFLQLIVDAGHPVQAISVNRGWIEFDTVEDVNRANMWRRTGVLTRFLRSSI